MLWFDGSIRNAVDKVKSSGVILLVFVQGEDSLSKKYESFLNKESKFESQDYVAIKIPSGSVGLQQFKQIYVSVPIPSVFLIGSNGIPIKVVSSDQTSDIYNAISESVEKQKRKYKKKNELESNGDAFPDSKKTSVGQAQNCQRAQNIGDNVIEIPEIEIKKRRSEIRAFPRFLLIDHPSAPDTSSPPAAPAVPKLQSARIQFRLPNNEVPAWEFPDRSTLGDVRAYLVEKVKLSSNFKLLRTHPGTAFAPQDLNKTLAELSLIPNATLIVVPVQDKTVQAKIKSLIPHQSFLTTALKTLLQPIFAVLKYFKKHVLKIPEDTEVKTRRLVSDTAIEKILNKKTSTSNIHGFKFDEDSDVDNDHPDNGNSTQQRFQK